MSDVKENSVIEEKSKWEADGSEWIWILLFAMIFGGWGNAENPRISELEKKVSRIEGQVSMIGGKRYE